MIYHTSFAVHNPSHVARVIAELWQGVAVPFPGHSGSFMALALDAHGTMIEFLPKEIVLRPGLQEGGSVWFESSDSTTANYTASHVNIAVPISEAEIYAIAEREGWRAVRCNRQDFFELIELWVENEVLIELLPPSMIQQYQEMMKPENLQNILNIQ